MIKHQEWLTDQLKQKVRNRFESKYQRALTDDEVIRIAESLANLIKLSLKIKSRNLPKS